MLVLDLIFYLTALGGVSGANKMKYLSTERPEITWSNPKYITYVNLTAKRYSRADPYYYIGFHMDLIWPIHNNVNIDFFFYEFVTNQYKRSFIELHLDLCELIVKDLLFGISLGLFFPHPCPITPGIYHVDNITVPMKNIPGMISFTKGRVKANITSKDTNELLGYGHIDLYP